MEPLEKSIVFFHKPGFGLDQAEQALRKTTMTVTRKGDFLSVVWEDGPELTVRYRHGEEVLVKAFEISQDTPFEGQMNEFDSAFEISFDDLDEVLDDINTLIETQICLQSATNGVNFCSWNDQLQGPEDLG